jgi:23S rRNA pseudouridine1911/1915/1917 synthase
LLVQLVFSQKTGEKLSDKILQTISFEFVGERLDSFVLRFFENFSRNKIQAAIESSFVLVNKQTAKKSYALRENDIVEMDEEKISAINMPNSTIIPVEIPLEILFEDEHYVILNKVGNLTVHPGRGQINNTLLNALYFYAGQNFTPILAHRLDRYTSGAIIAAKSETAHDKMSEKFANREIYKGYVGICIGKFPNEMSGIIEFPIGRDKKDPTKRAVDYQNGRSARTDYKIVNYQNGIYFTCFRLHSGRTHQIRIHCANSGFPIICDELYGGSKERIKFLEQNDRDFALKIYNCFERQALHARFISFVHPFSNETISIFAPFPADFCSSFNEAGLSEEIFNIFNGEIV